jgi:hypothetical protein
MLVVFILSFFVLGCGAIGLYTQRFNRQRRSRILNAPTSAIAQASGTGHVEVKGRIVPSEQGVLMTPFSNQHAVWARVTVQEWRQQGRSGSFVTIIQKSDARQFMVDDGSGQLARIVPDMAHTIIDERQVAKSGMFNNATPPLEAFLQAHGQKSVNMLGMNKNMRYVEEVLRPGENVFAIGASRREPGPPVSDGYRMVPSSQLVMFHGGPPADELILSNKPEEKIVSKLLFPSIGFGIMLALGALGLLGGLAATIFAAVTAN